MDLFPPLALLNRYYIGDTVLLTGIAEGLAKEYNTKVYVISNYPELLENHPYAIGKSFDQMDSLPKDCRLLDMSESIKSIRVEEIEYKGNKKKTVQIPMPNKLTRMFNQAGLIETVKPTLSLTDQEIRRASEIRQRYGGKMVTVGAGSRHDFKVWAYYDLLVKNLVGKYNVFVIDDKKESCDFLSKYPVNFLIGLPLRELMINLYAMDYYIGNDSGPAHIAFALGVQGIVIGYDIAKELYEKYEDIEFLESRVLNLKNIPARKVIKKTAKYFSNGYKDVSHRTRPHLFNLAVDRKTRLALFRLDGFGGSITVGDHAKKIYEKYGIKSSLVIRGNKDIFRDNPYVEEVITVGHTDWIECLEQMKSEFGIVAEIRFALCKLHQLKFKLFEQDYTDKEGVFNEFPHNYNKLEVHHLHHVQITDMEMELPYDTIDSQVFCFDKPKIELPENYIVMNDGVDSLYKGARQTKCWNEWDELSESLDCTKVVVGTEYDRKIVDCIDLRNQLTIPELFWVLQNANGVICCEGGIMHASYACGSRNVFVLRGPTTGRLFEYPGHRFIDSYACDQCWSITGDWYMNCPKGINAMCMESISWERVKYNVERVIYANMV